MRILLIEDDAMIGQGIQRGLKQDGFTVDWVQKAADGELAMKTASYDLVLLDLGLPDTSGLSLLKSMRSRGVASPVLIVTARDAIADRVAGLDAGADDYLVKPFDLEELAARIRALNRRHLGRHEPEIKCGALVIVPSQRAVRVNDVPVTLSAREYALLLALAERPGVVLSRSQLEEKLYGWGDEVGSNTIEVYVHSLRRKLGADRIRNVRGVGYMLSEHH